MIIDSFQFAVGVNLLSQESEGGDLLFRILQVLSGADRGVGNSVVPFCRFLITANAVFGEKVHGGGRPF